MVICDFHSGHRLSHLREAILGTRLKLGNAIIGLFQMFENLMPTPFAHDFARLEANCSKS